jgi:dTDP-4-amino-4,6-dideoxygalactose transaminase
MFIIDKFLIGHKKINFIKPYWNEEEFLVGLGKVPIKETSPLDNLSNKLAEIVGLNQDWKIWLTGSGRCAFELALRGLKKKFPKRIEVILPSYGCKGTLDPILNCELTPVFIDIDGDLLPDESKMIDQISERTLVCLVVNLTGKQKSWHKLIKYAHSKGAIVVIDDCQNLKPGGKEIIYEDKADLKIYSFGMGKNACATTGGALVSRVYINEINKESNKLITPSIYEAKERFEYQYQIYFKGKNAKILDKPEPKSYYGFNTINPIDAELMVLQLGKLSNIISQRQNNAAKIYQSTSNFPKIMKAQTKFDHIYTKFSLTLCSPLIRDRFFSMMRDFGIELEGMYIPLHLRGIANKYKSGNLDISESVYPYVYNVPVRPQLTSDEVGFVSFVIDKFGQKYG